MREAFAIFLFTVTALCSCDRRAQHQQDAAAGIQPDGSGLLESWPPGGPQHLWTYSGLGKGYGGPLVTEQAIFINAEEDGNSYTVALGLDGTFHWKSPNGKEFSGMDFSATYPGTRATPSIKGNLVYSVSGTGHLSCFDSRTGKVIWAADLINDYNGLLGDFGYSETPVVDGHLVYGTPGGRVHNVVALDRMTGALVWSSPVNRDHFSYGTPLLLDFPDRELLVGASRNYVHVLDRRNGELLSSYPLENIREGWEHCNSLVHKDGFLYYVLCEEDGQGTVKLHLSRDGSSLQEVWRNSEVNNVFEGFEVAGTTLYAAMENRRLIGLDTETGEIRHTVRSVNGNIVHAGDKLILYGHNGTVQLFSLVKGEPQLRSEFRIREGSGHHFSFPVIADGVMYIRRGEALMAFAVR